MNKPGEKFNLFELYKYPILLLAVITLITGIFAYTNMKTGLFPEVSFPKIKVIIEAGSQPVDQMAMTITRPVEQAIKKVPGITDLRSTTSRGSLEIAVIFNWGQDLDLSQHQIASTINQIRGDLPADIHVSIEKMTPATLPVMGYSLVSHSIAPMALRQLAEFTIKPFLAQAAGVSDITVAGGQQKEYWLEMNLQKMSALGITPGQIAAVIGSTNAINSSGYVADYRTLYLSVTDARIMNAAQISRIIIKSTPARVIRVADLASVSVHAAKQYQRINADGKPGILIGILQQPGANLLDVSTAIKAKVKKLSGILPAGVSLVQYYNQADFVQNAVHSVADCLWIGLLLAVIVAVIFLKSIKPSLTLLLTIPIVLSLTIFVLKLTGQGLNIMTLGAIAASIGLIIDDAIVVVEQIQRTHEEFTGIPSGSLVKNALHYLLKAMIGSSLSTVVIFIPFGLMSGVAGAYFTVMTHTMIITLVCSFFVTWLILPVIYLLVCGASGQKATGVIASSHQVKEQKWVRFFIKKPVYSLAFVLVMILATIWILPRLSTGFLPEMDEGTIVMDYSSPPGTTLDQTNQMLGQVDKIIAGNKQVENFNRRTGSQMGFFITEPNTGDYLIRLKKDKSVPTEQVISELRRQIEASQPALLVDFGQVIGDMLGDLMAAARPIEIQIFGRDQAVLQQKASQVAAIVGMVKGTADVFDGITIAGPSLVTKPDFEQLARFGITLADFQLQTQSYLNGTVVGTVTEPLQLTPIRMRYQGPSAQPFGALSRQSILLPGGEKRPVADFARMHIEPGVAELQRDNLQNMAMISARLENRDLGGTIQEIQQKIKQDIHLPKGYSITYGGAYKEQQQSFKELIIILCLSSLLVFTVILFLYREFWVACAILFISILGVSGCFILLYLSQTPLNVGSYTGVIMIVGIIAENAIFTYAQFRESMKTMDREHSIIYAISTRLRPKLMTAIGAIIALSPLALGIGTGAKMHQPLAIAVIGGFIVALPLLLIVLPTLLLKLPGRSDPDQRL